MGKGWRQLSRAVFVLTHCPRPAPEMRGGTTCHVVTEGFHAVRDAARKLAPGGATCGRLRLAPARPADRP